jgi:para-aminobenzoate synthetase
VRSNAAATCSPAPEHVKGGPVRALLIDNYDSYTYNLYQLLGAVSGRPPTVLRNDAPELAGLDDEAFDAIVVSPGPGRPDRAGDVGHCLAALRRTRLPVLGVCLGHQALGLLDGARVTLAPTPRHGFRDRIRHNGDALFAGVPQGFAAVRYHSLCLRSPLPAPLLATAWGDDGVVMALRHRRLPRWGVQFHPESIGTEHGGQLIANFLELARAARADRAAGPTGRGAYLTTRHLADRAGKRNAPDLTAPRRSPWRLVQRRLPFEVDTERAFAALFAASPHAFWLDTSRPDPPRARFSFLGDSGGPHGEVLSYRLGAEGTSDGVLRVLAPGGGCRLERGNVFELLRRRLADRALGEDPGLPFDLTSGYVGYLGYELKADLGVRNRHLAPGPDAVWIAATRMVAVDHQAGLSWVLALCRAQAADQEAARRWISRASARLDRRRLRPAAEPARSPGPAGPQDAPELAERLVRGRSTYLRDVARCQQALRAGESYELCLTDQVRMPYQGSPLALYRRQRRRNPAPYAGYLWLDGTAVLCASPERFLRVDRAGVAESRPIKGTAARHPDPAIDASLRDGLASSAKDRAENLMIVDLLRHDLGQVCELGTVEVHDFMRVESYQTVHQLVSAVRGKLRPGVDALDAVRACFPPGSMTGAPKLRTLRLLDEIETEARGVYAGALGYVGLTGGADLAVVIRSMVVRDGVLRAGAGGAVVLDSDPEQEYAEMLLKARTALAGTDPGPTTGVGLTLPGLASAAAGTPRRPG